MDELRRAAKVDLSDVTDETALRGGIPIDSLGMLNVFLKVEERLGVEIEEEAIDGARTVGDLIDCIVAASEQ